VLGFSKDTNVPSGLFRPVPGTATIAAGRFIFPIRQANKDANGKTAGNNRKQSEGVNNPPIRVLYLYGRTETGVHGE
jgi:hypothetical protein